jgi:SHS2 domain-containing protein
MARGSAPIRSAAVAPGAQRSHWEHLDHGADIGVRGLGPTKAGAFEQAALALTAVIVDPAAIEPRETVEIVCEGADDETLLLAWLNAVIAEMAARGMLFSRFHVELRPRQVVATASGERVAVERHHRAVDVKRATDRDLRVTRLRTGEWLAQSVLDV